MSGNPFLPVSNQELTCGEVKVTPAQCLHSSALLLSILETPNTNSAQCQSLRNLHNTRGGCNLLSSPRLETPHGWEGYVAFGFLPRKSDPLKVMHTHTDLQRCLVAKGDGKKTSLFSARLIDFRVNFIWGQPLVLIASVCDLFGGEWILHSNNQASRESATHGRADLCHLDIANGRQGSEHLVVCSGHITPSVISIFSTGNLWKLESLCRLWNTDWGALIQDSQSRLFKMYRNPVIADFERDIGTIDDPIPELYQRKLWRCEYINILNQSQVLSRF